LNDELGDGGAVTMQEELQNEHNPAWKWLWERLLLPIKQDNDGGIMRVETPYLRLLRKIEDNQSCEE
jgi:hypothetical protein